MREFIDLGNDLTAAVDFVFVWPKNGKTQDEVKKLIWPGKGDARVSDEDMPTVVLEARIRSVEFLNSKYKKEAFYLSERPLKDLRNFIAKVESKTSPITGDELVEYLLN